MLNYLNLIFQKLDESDSTTTKLTTVVPLDEITTLKKSGLTTERMKVKSSTPTFNRKKESSVKPSLKESDIDMENLPVIQGSFEITKTEADISQKRSDLRPASTASLTPSTLKPFYISPVSSIKIKSNEHPSTLLPPSIAIKNNSSDSNNTKNILEMFLQHQNNLVNNLKEQSSVKPSTPVTAKIEKTDKISTTTVTSFTTIPESSSTTESPTTIFYSTTIEMNRELPKLDVSLFTSAPIIDNEPWKPINPSQEQIRKNNSSSSSLADETNKSSSSLSFQNTSPTSLFRSPFNPKPVENGMYRNKFQEPDSIFALNDTDDSSPILYQSFYNADFSAASLEIEKLGISDVKPYPLPVNKIDTSEETKDNNNNIQHINMNNDKTIVANDTRIKYDENKFEHLGGGVIAKKTEANESLAQTTAIRNVTNENSPKIEIGNDGIKLNANISNEQNYTKFDDIFQELINDNDLYNNTSSDILESRIVSDNDNVHGDDDDDDDDDDGAEEDGDDDDNSGKVTTETNLTTQKLNFLNMKNFIVQMQQNKSNPLIDDSSTISPLSTTAQPYEREAEKSAESVAILDTTKKPIEIMSVTNNPHTTFKPTATFVKHDTTLPSAVIKEPQLFPSITKWEFVNGTRSNISETSVTKKIFNETLQAVIVENAQSTPHPTFLDNLKVNRTVNKTNLQQLSSIFDTLASKLGINTDVSSKLPPFSQTNTRSKLQQNVARNNTKVAPSSVRYNFNSANKSVQTTSKMKQPALLSTTTEKMTTNTMDYFTSSENNFGRAEVVPVDPTQYDEILSLASSPITKFVSTTSPSIVTLMPVKSNSGIRNFNPRLKLPVRQASSASKQSSKNMETVVKTSMTFDA
jgi:hypothetical protein